MHERCSVMCDVCGCARVNIYTCVHVCCAGMIVETSKHDQDSSDEEEEHGHGHGHGGTHRLQ